MEKFDKAEREQLFRKNIQLINPKNVMEIFHVVYARVQQHDIRIFYDFLGELLLEKYSLFGEKKKFLKKYLRFVRKVKIPLDHKLILEEYLIEKYFTLEGEGVLLSFHGKIVHGDLIYSGRVFITNQRILVIGKTEKKASWLDLLA